MQKKTRKTKSKAARTNISKEKASQRKKVLETTEEKKQKASLQSRTKPTAKKARSKKESSKSKTGSAKSQTIAAKTKSETANSKKKPTKAKVKTEKSDTKATSAKRKTSTSKTKPAKTKHKTAMANTNAKTNPSAAKRKTATSNAKPRISNEKLHSANVTSISGKQENNGGPEKRPAGVLSIDIGGTSAKMLLSGQVDPRKAPSGPTLTPAKLLEIVAEQTSDWKFDYVTIGYPGLVGPNGPIAEPGNLGSGWVSFDFQSAFGKPVKILNDAAMQAIGSYDGGRMLFLGLGTGFGSTLIVNNTILELELSNLRWDAKNTIGDVLSKKSLRRIGVKKWRAAVEEIVEHFMRAMLVDYIVVGGGNAKLLKKLPAGARLGHNQTAFQGGFKVWEIEKLQEENFNRQSNSGPWKIL